MDFAFAKGILRMKQVTTFLVACLLGTGSAMATPLTETSPTGGALPAGTTRVGGIVADLTGTNGTRVVSQLSASSLFVGQPASTPTVIGTQAGFSAAILAAFGGGLSAASFRVTLFDGDSAAGNFDDGTDLMFLVDGANLGFWSSVATQETSNDGLTLINSGFGFGDDILSTGWFSTNNAGTLAAIFAGLGDGSLTYRVQDVDPGDNFYDFTRGVAGGLINVGQGPVITPLGAVPEPGTWVMMLLGFGAIGASLRRRKPIAALA